MNNKFVIAELEKEGFTCPNCTAYSNHDWTFCSVNETEGRFCHKIYNSDVVENLYLCKCQHCGYISFWYKNKLIWPLASSVEAPIEEMDKDIKELYNEARDIIESSPKGSCAILRLALQKLCNRLADQEENKKIDGAIKKLVEKGLPTTIQKAMDTIRIVGDEAVHPGEININDNKDLAIAMFRLLNMIVEKMIVEPKQIDDLYNLMPKNKLEGIGNRDKKKK